MKTHENSSEESAVTRQEMPRMRKHRQELSAHTLILAAALATAWLSGCATTHVDNARSDEPWGYKPARWLGDVVVKIAPF